jgi:hypothetical protein
MWSAIGRATARQVRVGGGRAAIRSASRLAVHSASRTVPAIPSGIRVAAVFARGLAAVGRPRKTTKTEDSAAPKKKAVGKKAPAKTASKAKAPAEKKKKKAAAGRPKAPLTEEQKTRLEEQKTRLKIRELRKKALLKEEPRDLPNTPWMILLGERTKVMKEDSSIKLVEVARNAAIEYKGLSPAELEVSRKSNLMMHTHHVKNGIAH